MATRPSERPSENREAPQNHSLFSEVESLGEILGDPYPSVPEDMTVDDIDKRLEEIMNDYTYETYQEQNESNALNFAVNRLQRLRQYREHGSQESSAAEERESVVVNQAVTYHEYFPDVVNHVYSIMTKYQARRATAPAEVVRGLAGQEMEARLYLAALNSALEERVAFANVLLMEGFLRLGKTPSGDDLSSADKAFIENRLKQHLSNPNLSEPSKLVLEKRDTKQNKIKGNELNQRIIDILSGKSQIAGVDEGFFPQQLYLDLLSREYEFHIENAKGIVRDSDSSATEARMRLLEQRHELDDGLSSEDLAEYERLRAVIRGRNQAFGDMRTTRATIIEELVEHTNQLGTFQLHAAELSTLQHQFGAREDPDAEGLTDDRTPEQVRRAISENMEQRSSFHLERLDAFANTMEEKVLSVGFKEHVEDASIGMRDLYLGVTSGIAEIVAFPVPETAGLKARVRRSVQGDLAEAMGWPLDANGQLVDEKDLTPEQRKYIEKKAKSIKDAINEFDRTKIVRFRETVNALHSMPSAEEFINDEVKEIPTERITAQNQDELIRTYGGPAVYARLFQQLQEDWGDYDAQPPTGLIGESREFLHKVDENISTHLDVSKALHELSEGAFDAMWWTIVGIIGAGALVSAGLWYRSSGTRMRRIARHEGRDTEQRMRTIAQEEVGKAKQELEEELARTRQDLETNRGRTGTDPKIRPGAAEADGIADPEAARRAAQGTDAKLADADLETDQESRAKTGDTDTDTDVEIGRK